MDGYRRFLKATGDADVVQDCITTADKTLSDYQVRSYVACMRRSNHIFGRSWTWCDEYIVLFSDRWYVALLFRFMTSLQ